MGRTCALCGLAFYLCRFAGLVGQAASIHSLPTVLGCRPREYQSSKHSSLLIFLAPQQGKSHTQLAAACAHGPPESRGQQSTAIVRPCVLCSLHSSIHSAVAAGAPEPQHPQVNLTAVWTGPRRDFSESQRLQRGRSGYSLSVGEGEEYLHYLQSLNLCLLYPSSSGYQNITKQRCRQLSTLSLSRDYSYTQFYSRC